MHELGTLKHCPKGSAYTNSIKELYAQYDPAVFEQDVGVLQVFCLSLKPTPRLKLI
jgi:hypothetical protein